MASIDPCPVANIANEFCQRQQLPVHLRDPSCEPDVATYWPRPRLFSSQEHRDGKPHDVAPHLTLGPKQPLGACHTGVELLTQLHAAFPSAFGTTKSGGASRTPLALSISETLSSERVASSDLRQLQCGPAGVGEVACRP